MRMRLLMTFTDTPKKIMHESGTVMQPDYVGKPEDLYLWCVIGESKTCRQYACPMRYSCGCHLELAPGPYPPAIGPLSVTPPAVGRITTMTIRYPPDSLIDIGCWTRTISGSYRADSEKGRSGIGPTARGVTDSGPTASRQWCQ